MPESKLKKLAVVVLGALVVIIVIAGVALISRGGGNTPVRIILPTPQDSAGGNAPAGTRSSQTTESEPELQVYVSGAVRRPGVYTLKPGDRLIDAVEAAGGETPEADLEAVNLALRVQDEAQYKIPRIGEPPDPNQTLSQLQQLLEERRGTVLWRVDRSEYGVRRVAGNATRHRTGAGGGYRCRPGVERAFPHH